MKRAALALALLASLWFSFLGARPGHTEPFSQLPLPEQSLDTGIGPRNALSPNQARTELGFLAGTAAIVILGLVGVLLSWYLKGRERPAPVVEGYLSAPPSRLPPGLVAFLVDEELTTKGVLATLLHLAERGLAMALWQGGDLRLVRMRGGLARKENYTRLPDGRRAKLSDYERTLFYAVLGGLERGEEISPSSLGERFVSQLPRIYGEMAGEGRRYFILEPEMVRRRYVWFGEWLLALAASFTLVALLSGRPYGSAVFAPGIGLAVVGLAVMLLSRAMPRHTPTPMQEATRWRAFRRYLASLERHGDMASARDAMDEHFGYAVALGVAKAVLEQCAELGVQLPAWSLLPGADLFAPLQGVGDLAGNGLASSQPSWEPGPGKPVLLSDVVVGEGGARQRLSELLFQSLETADQHLARLLDSPLGEAAGRGEPESLPRRLVLDVAGTTLILVAPAAIRIQDVLGELLAVSGIGAGGGRRAQVGTGPFGGG